MLVVEDDEAVRTMILRYLAAQGVGALGVAGAEDALAELVQGGIDVVLCDHALPRHDGVWLLREIAARPSLASVRCVMISGDAGAKDALTAAGFAGSVVFVRKPLRLAALAVLVRRLRGARTSATLPAVA